MTKKYRMTISRLIVDKLGVKLYDRVSAVIAEMIANSYDADATEVEVLAPMLKEEFQKFYKEKTKKDLVLDVFSDGTKRADFVLSNQERSMPSKKT